MASEPNKSVLLASNRGPVSFRQDDAGRLHCVGGSGGLSSALAAIPPQEDALWVAAALSDADRLAARSAPSGRLDAAGYDTGTIPVRLLDIEPLTFTRAYNGIANSTLWFLHHLLFDTANTPLFDRRFRREWASYVDYNTAFAQALAEGAAPGGRVLIQDYHLTLAPQLLRTRRPDLAVGHFSHTPWAPPDYFRLLPDDVAVALLEGLLAADHAGFLTDRWARAFLACCESVLDARVDWAHNTVEYAGRRTVVGVHPLGVDAGAMRARANAPDVWARMAGLRAQVGDQLLVVRVDRAELSKNIVRGLLAYRELLRRRPEWQGRVVHAALAYPSRHDIPEYREYSASVQRVAKEIVDEFGSPDWDPLVLAVDDDYARSLAAYRMAHVAVVNPIRDGMNLVAKEIPIVSDNGCALVLSREAGAAVDLGDAAFLINPFDIEETAEAMHAALSLRGEERRARSAVLAEAAGRCPPRDWLTEQLKALAATADR
ncbi:alpha,alpha-trehalose-phosphate synthase (UDP-forming) [Actinopolymorpha rutila]|uniref:Trehalose 6-phosphate synthase n=1 Tax=Actinopolymorpha rutila TaxID=446787 RepID=A0A852Z7L0_9ACTN|nr:trehalose-6-phosphate synthase [Actinopolymorpha rutila]NYH88363.1 trehalose 6-phosphate synthase [Actinopolymorpha rutila]